MFTKLLDCFRIWKITILIAIFYCDTINTSLQGKYDLLHLIICEMPLLDYR